MTFSTYFSPGVSLQGGGGASGGGGTPGGSSGQIQYNNGGAFGGAAGITTNGTNLSLGSASQLLWSTDLILTRKGARNLQLGAADAATALAQTFSTQSVVAGTTNGAGADFTITGSQGTGTGAGGSIIFQTASAGSSGSAQNVLSERMRITSDGRVGVNTTSFSGNARFQVTSSTQYTGYVLNNGTNDSVRIIGYGATNDEGGVSILAGGVETIRLLATSAIPSYFNSGNVGFGTTSPSSAAALDVTSTTRGFLPPRMTTTQRDLISSPPNGLVLYNSTTDKLQVRAAGSWVDLH